MRFQDHFKRAQGQKPSSAFLLHIREQSFLLCAADVHILPAATLLQTDSER